MAGAGARAALLAERRAGGPFHVATLLDNVPEHVLWLGRRPPWSARSSSGGTPPTGATTWPETWPTPSASCWSPTGPIFLSWTGLDLGPGIGTVGALEPERVLVVDDDRLPGRAGHPRRGTAPRPLGRRCRRRQPRLPDLHLGHLGCPQGVPLHPGAAGPHRDHRGPDVLAHRRGRLLRVDAPVPLQRARWPGSPPPSRRERRSRSPPAGRFSASGFLPDVRRHGVTYFNYVGKPLSYILATPEQPDDADNPLVRVFGNEGAEADIVALRRTLRVRGGRQLRVHRGRRHGATRTPDTPRGALGRAPEGTMVVDPETGEECPVARFDADGVLVNSEEAVGELVSTSGASGFEGYWRNDEAEVARLRNGWYWTGDLAYRDEAGFFYFAGRDPTTGCASTGRTSRPPRWLASWSATPTSCWPRSTPCPTPSWATRSWRRCSSGPESCRPGGVRHLPRRPERPGDEMGAALRAGLSGAPHHRHLQGPRADPAGRAVELHRPRVVATGPRWPLRAVRPRRCGRARGRGG